MTAADDPAPGRIVLGARAAALLGLLVLVGFVIRVDALRNEAPAVPALGDAHAYHVLALNLADGRGYNRPYDWEREGRSVATAEYPPGLPATLAVAARLGVRSEQGQRMVLAAIGAVTVGLIGLIGRRLAGDGAGLAAAAIAAVDPGLWNNDVSLMAEPLAACAGAALVLAALGALDRPGRLRWAALGAVAGLGCLVRSEFLLAGPVLIALVAWRTEAAWRPRLRSLVVGLAALAVVLAPWTIRNLATFGEVVPLSNNSGSVSRGANCDAAYHGPYRGLWVTDVRLGGAGDPALAGCFSGFAIDAHTNEAVAAARLRSDGLSYARHHLGELPGVMAARLGRTVGLYRLDQQVDFAGAEGRNPRWERRGLRVFQVLALIAAAGLVADLVRRRDRFERLLVAVPVGAMLITVALTYGNPRFLAAAQPSIIALAAATVVSAASSRVRPEHRGGPGAPSAQDR